MKNHGPKIKDLIRSKINNSDDYNEIYMNVKFSSDDNLPLNKMLELRYKLTIVRDVFHENNNFYPQVFYECLYKI